ncbi:MAG: dTDP-4-dehydrorhamnose reductase [Candidatus Schekmanbacteria bacterium]|nr:dTDP-4-dehydrorhamnose reductase [Candidatus Schekmanbacteria bacterium]
MGNERVVVTGGAGMLARDLVKVFTNQYEVTCLPRAALDVADENAVLSCFRELQPNVVLHAAAYTQVDRAEMESAEAFRVNASGARAVARASAAVGAFLVAYSTDFVFSGLASAPYGEEAQTGPLCAYGRSKLAGELAVQEETDRYAVLRTAWLYGAGGGCFPKTMLRLAAAADKPLAVVCDQFGSPTFSGDLAALTVAVVRLRCQGLYHAVNEGVVSWFEFAREVLRCAGVARGVTAIGSDELDRPAKRPAYSALCTRRLRSAIRLAPRSWREALADFLEEIR